MWKCITLLHKYDKNQPVNEIKEKIEKHDYVLVYDYNAPYDVTDDLQNIDRNMLFRELLENLLECGAELETYQNNRKVTLEIIDNWFNTLKEIEKETQMDIDREVE